MMDHEPRQAAIATRDDSRVRWASLWTYLLALIAFILFSGFVAARASATEANQEREVAEDRSSSDAAKARGEINFDDLKFPIEKDQPFDDEMLIDSVRELDGRKVKLRGYILPTTLFTETNIRQFVLVRDNQECCFGPGAALFDCVIVDMVPGESIDFVTRPITVTGKFKIDTKTYRHPGGRGPGGASHLAIFHIDGESVR